MTIVNIFMIYVLGREVKLVVQCLEKIFVHLFSMIRLNLRNSGLI